MRFTLGLQRVGFIGASTSDGASVNKQTDKKSERDFLFEILLDNEVQGLTVIRGAAIRSCEDFLRARAELAAALPLAPRSLRR